jgi:hypothetical protein
MTIRTQEEILARFNAVEADDLFGHQRSDLLDYLIYDHAKPYLNDSVLREEWEGRKYLTPAERIKEYMPFAWDKANNCRGLSAGRSVEHMLTWLWLDGKDELADELFKVYEYYGKPCLVLVCREYGIDWEALDNDEWTQEEYGPHLKAKDALALTIDVPDGEESGIIVP